MKIDRLLGIITTLLQHDRVTAPELAKKYEVSTRTILRDIDDICKAGIPVITYQGGNGGISIADGYKIDKSALTVEELHSILAGLKSIASVSNSTNIEELISKLSPKSEAVISLKESIIIDLSSHYKSSLSDKINQIKSAIRDNKLIGFDYYSEHGKLRRIIEPYFITFRWTSWYVFGYCKTRNDFRLFKLNRLWRHEVLDERFIPRDIPSNECSFDDLFTDENRITILFDKSLEYRIIEEYGPDSYQVMEDGSLKLSVGYANKEYIVSWVLAFGDKARVLDPVCLADEIKEKAKNMVRLYEHDI